MKIVYQTNNEGYFVGTTYADECPIEKGVYLIPGGCVEEAPPAVKEDQYPRLVSGQWVVETIRPPAPEPEPTPEEKIERERGTMWCSPVQGILTLGPIAWQKVQDYRETATWAEKVLIDSSPIWERNSENIAFFGWLLDYTPDQMDDLFRRASKVKV